MPLPQPTHPTALRPTMSGTARVAASFSPTPDSHPFSLSSCATALDDDDDHSGHSLPSADSRSFLPRCTCPNVFFHYCVPRPQSSVHSNNSFALPAFSLSPRNSTPSVISDSLNPRHTPHTQTPFGAGVVAQSSMPPSPHNFQPNSLHPGGDAQCRSDGDTVAAHLDLLHAAAIKLTRAQHDAREHRRRRKERSAARRRRPVQE